jgi:protein-S-isoprenylcysteine O-methyltransferase Ste14
MDTREIKRKAVFRFSFGALAYAAIFFGTAGTFRYWEAWVFMAALFIPMIFSVAYFSRTDPEFLERRIKAREERDSQKFVQILGGIVWLGVAVIPGLDRRLGWTDVPILVVLLGNGLVLAGYYVAFLTMKENRFASRTIRVEEGQEVISTGPYALVRHPMYLGTLTMFLAVPPALGSYLALIPAAILPVLLALRILDEEKLLLEELSGYREYTKKTRYRLIPGVW